MLPRLGFFKKKAHCEILITGHPRCGTTSAASICQRLGLEVGDEWLGAYGMSSWMMAVSDRRNPYGDDEFSKSRRNLTWERLVLVVRDIKQAVPSVILENEHAPRSFAFRRKHIARNLGVDIGEIRDPVGRAILSLACWSRIILAQKPDFTFRIEDQQDEFRDFLSQCRLLSKEASSVCLQEHRNERKAYEGVTYEKPKISQDVWTNLEPDAAREVAWYCDEFGYGRPSDPNSAPGPNS